VLAALHSFTGLREVTETGCALLSRLVLVPEGPKVMLALNAVSVVLAAYRAYQSPPLVLYLAWFCTSLTDASEAGAASVMANDVLSTTLEELGKLSEDTKTCAALLKLLVALAKQHAHREAIVAAGTIEALNVVFTIVGGEAQMATACAVLMSLSGKEGLRSEIARRVSPLAFEVLLRTTALHVGGPPLSQRVCDLMRHDPHRLAAMFIEEGLGGALKTLQLAP
jgi:hypothetical protein